ncbi:MAG: carbohydrate kinase family protein [Clostridia bacterium]|nr:carbohydrate kinase family protein [Clostridia bacterium]
MSPKILTVGSSYFSMDLQIPSIPPAGSNVKVKNFIRYPEGSGIGTAVALEKLDTQCILCTSIGSDSHGKMIHKFLAGYLESMEYVHIEKGVSAGTCFHTEDPDGAKRSFIYDGANAYLTTDMVEDAFSSCPDAVIVNSDLPQELVYTAILGATTHQVPALVNLQGKEAARLPFDQFGDGTILVMDQANAQRYCGMRVQTVEECLKACISLAGKVKAKYFVIRLQGKGSFAYNGKYYYFVPNYDFIPADERGGEEYYNVALLLRFLLEGDIRMACEFAAVAETVAMLRPGGLSNLPSYEDIKSFIVDNELDEKLLI